MPLRLPHIMLSLFAIAGLDLAFPGEIARWIGAVPFPALLVGLPGMVATVRGLSPLTMWRMQWATVRYLARHGRATSLHATAVQPIFSRMKARPSAANEARSLLSLP
jgi:hypothetical protein